MYKVRITTVKGATREYVSEEKPVISDNGMFIFIQRQLSDGLDHGTFIPSMNVQEMAVDQQPDIQTKKESK